MGFIAPRLVAEDTGVPVENAYGKINHVELDIPTNYCRLDVHWFVNKDMSKEVRPFAVWSFTLNAEQLNALLRDDIQSTTLGAAYTLLRLGNSEKFKDIEDELSKPVEEDVSGELEP